MIAEREARQQIVLRGEKSELAYRTKKVGNDVV